MQAVLDAVDFDWGLAFVVGVGVTIIGLEFAWKAISLGVRAVRKS